MPSRKPGNLRDRVVDALDVEGLAALEKRVLVAEVAVLWTPARDDDRIGNEVIAASNQISANRGHALQGASRGRPVDGAGTPLAEIREKLRKHLLAWSEEDGVRVCGRFRRQGGDMESAQNDEHASCPVRVGETVRAVGVGDVHL